MDEAEKDPHAVALGRKGGLKGGAARAASLSPEDRSNIAKRAAQAKWSKALPKEEYPGVLTIGDLKIRCAVLDDGTRVLSQRGFYKNLGSGNPGRHLDRDTSDSVPAFLAAANLKPFISAELMSTAAQPVAYRARGPKGGWMVAHGIKAEIIPEICAVWLKARAAGKIHRRQQTIADKAAILMAGLARVGIIALVDEATGYQADRAKDELQKILQAYVIEEMRPWMQVFPTEFFRQAYRLMGWEFKEGTAKRTPYIGKLINEWIYGRLPAPVLPRLREINPPVNGYRRHKHHQFLTEDTGIPHLDRQLAVVTALMRASKDRAMFDKLLVDACPKPGDQRALDLISDDDS